MTQYHATQLTLHRTTTVRAKQSF